MFTHASLHTNTMFTHASLLNAKVDHHIGPSLFVKRQRGQNKRTVGRHDARRVPGEEGNLVDGMLVRVCLMNEYVDPDLVCCE